MRMGGGDAGLVVGRGICRSPGGDAHLIFGLEVRCVHGWCFGMLG